MMSNKNILEAIVKGNTSLGIELGSTRIKSVLITSKNEEIATGSFTWKNKFEDNYWTYSEQDIWQGLQAA